MHPQVDNLFIFDYICYAPPVCVWVYTQRKVYLSPLLKEASLYILEVYINVFEDGKWTWKEYTQENKGSEHKTLHEPCWEALITNNI